METPYYPGIPYEVKLNTSDPVERIVRRSYERAVRDNAAAAKGCGHWGTQRLIDFVQAYQIDGIIMHGTKSCRASTVGQTFSNNLLRDHVKLPTLFIESDIVDARDYSEAQTKMKIDAFMETLAVSSAHKRG